MGKFIYRLILACAIVATIAGGTVYYQQHTDQPEAQIAGTLVMRE